MFLENDFIFSIFAEIKVRVRSFASHSFIGRCGSVQKTITVPLRCWLTLPPPLETKQYFTKHERKVKLKRNIEGNLYVGTRIEDR